MAEATGGILPTFHSDGSRFCAIKWTSAQTDVLFPLLAGIGMITADWRA